jgi:Tfp pilus assembly protein PilV
MTKGRCASKGPSGISAERRSKFSAKADGFVMGQSLFEVLLALAVITLTVVGIASLSTYAVSNTTYSRNKNQATRYAQEGIEWVRSERDSNITNFLSNASGTWCLSSLTWSSSHSICTSQVIANTQFTRNLIFSTVTKDGKQVKQAEVKVSWSDSKSTREVSSTTYFSDWRLR